MVRLQVGGIALLLCWGVIFADSTSNATNVTSQESTGEQAGNVPKSNNTEASEENIIHCQRQDSKLRMFEISFKILNVDFQEILLIESSDEHKELMKQLKEPIRAALEEGVCGFEAIKSVDLTKGSLNVHFPVSINTTETMKEINRQVEESFKAFITNGTINGYEIDMKSIQFLKCLKTDCEDIKRVRLAVLQTLKKDKMKLMNDEKDTRRYFGKVTMPALITLMAVLVLLLVLTAGKDALLCRICSERKTKETKKEPF